MSNHDKINVNVLVTNVLLMISIAFGIALTFITSGKNQGKSLSGLDLSLSKPAIKVINVYNIIQYQQTVPQVLAGLKSAVDQKNVVGVILRINSGGGTVGASQEIYRKILDFKKKTRKPVVAVFGDVAASGAYYIACASDKIFARPGTLTGSIGVIMAGYTFQELFQRYGIRQEIVKSGKYKDMGSAIGRHRSPDEYRLLKSMVDSTYRQFFEVVLSGRKGKITDTKLKLYADGRIM
ncbi:MAG: signal peptide peptidase SppA, partial [Spirochaetota bacterium]|nr:signal peptide peptidase SppA [Spirochaetota bacterium]